LDWRAEDQPTFSPEGGRDETRARGKTGIFSSIRGGLTQTLERIEHPGVKERGGDQCGVEGS